MNNNNKKKTTCNAAYSFTLSYYAPGKGSRVENKHQIEKGGNCELNLDLLMDHET
jgi:hypothetical protein